MNESKEQQTSSSKMRSKSKTKLKLKSKSSRSRRKRPTSRKQKPLKIDVSSLLNHLKVMQKSIPHLQQHDQDVNKIQPTLQMLNFQSKKNATGAGASASASANEKSTGTYSSGGNGGSSTRKSVNDEKELVQDWYILVASTPYAISAQLISIPKGTNGEVPDIVVPDFIQCTPISVWTSTPVVNYDGEIDEIEGQEGQGQGQGQESKSKYHSKNLETLNCEPRIVTQEPPPTSSSQEYLQVAILCGLKSSRLLSIQLSIYAYVGMQGCEGRFVMTKAQKSGNNGGASMVGGYGYGYGGYGEEGVIEPLIIDSEDDVKRRRIMIMEQLEQQQLQQQQQRKLNPMDINNMNANASSQTHGSKDHDHDESTSITSTLHSAPSKEEYLKNLSKWVPFRPVGGVASISPLYQYHHGNPRRDVDYADDDDDCEKDYFMWITYGDGTFVRMPRWSFFGLEDLEDLDHPIHHGKDLAFRGNLDLIKAAAAAGVNVAGGKSVTESHVVIPMPKFFPTLLSQPSEYPFASPSIELPDISFDNINEGLEGDDDDSSMDEDADEELNFSRVGRRGKEKDELGYEFFEAICYRKEESSVNSASHTYPTLAFYTNEDQLFSNTHKIATSEVQMSTVENIIRGGTSIIGGTAAFAKTMLGGMMGVLNRSKAKNIQEREGVGGMEIRGVSSNVEDDNCDIERSTRASLFPMLHNMPNTLTLGTAMYDAPRRITHVSIDPDGNLMACADNLGRVQLVDLDTKQCIRIWKGFRESTCHWMKLPYTIDDEIHIVKYLAIHSRQRNVVEIFRTKQGPRVGKFDVRSDGVSLVQCPLSVTGRETNHRSFELRISRSSNKSSILKEVIIVDDELITASRKGATYINASNGGGFLSPAQQRAQEGSIQMQLLKQLLEPESAIQSDLNEVYDALTQITVISDLTKALDLLALATHLRNMGVSDSSFHSEVVLHAREQLDIALDDQAVATSKNPHVHVLSRKIDFHTKLILAYDEIYEFETSERSEDSSVFDEDASSDDTWVGEALGWIDTYENVGGYSIDSDVPAQVEPELTLSTFAKGCLQGGPASSHDDDARTLKLYLCDSTRDRKQILLHLFRPLTEDVFSLRTTHQVFKHMGLVGDIDTLLQYYGEWFMSLPKEVIRKQCGGIWCPAVRWLRDVVVEYLENNGYGKEGEQDDGVLLKALHNFCSNAEDLPRAFSLCLVCHKAISAATSNVEDKTYGLISSLDCLKPWEILLRKIRTCLLISLRLCGINIGALPITVSTVNAGDTFSIYQFIAHDELSLTHKTMEIVELELACIASPFAFAPSLEEADAISNFKMLHTSCVERHKLKNLCPDDAIGPAPLLFFLQHYYDSLKLASHRALLLAQKWGREPESLHLLDDALSALRSVDDASLLSAICQEIWNSYLRPVYRGVLFGFHEAHELCEEIISPLCDDSSWFGSLNRLSTELIVLMRSTIDGLSQGFEDIMEDKSGLWPPLQTDIILESLVKRSGSLDDSSLEMHSAAICAIQLTDSMEPLTLCFPTLDFLFLRESFSTHEKVTIVPNDEQTVFIDDALKRKAARFEGKTVSYADLDDIVTLGRAWGMDKSQILTEYLLVMYEVGKDDMIQHLITSTRLIEVERFQDGAMSIACVRLQAALTALKKSKQYRSVLAMLDADTCEWVKEQAEISVAENPNNIYTHDSSNCLIPLLNTKELILRIKRMSPANRIDANALSTMCETLSQATDVFG